MRPIYRIVSFLPLSNFAVFDGCCFTMINIIIIIIIIYFLLLAKHCTNFSNEPTLSTFEYIFFVHTATPFMGRLIC